MSRSLALAPSCLPALPLLDLLGLSNFKTFLVTMGAGASAQGAESAAIFDQLMAKWDTLAQEPQFSGSGDLAKPGMSLRKPGAHCAPPPCIFVAPSRGCSVAEVVSFY